MEEKRGARMVGRQRDIDARMRVVMPEEAWPRGHEESFNDGSAQDIL